MGFPLGRRVEMARVMEERYAVYFIWNDGTEDSILCWDAKDRDMNIKDMIDRKDFKFISWCRIDANGEYGIDKVVLRDGRRVR